MGPDIEGVPLLFRGRLAQRCFRSLCRRTTKHHAQADYFSLVLFNVLFIALGFFGLLTVVGTVSKPLPQALVSAVGMSALLALLFFFVYLRYPLLLARKRAEQLERNLAFALKDLYLQVTSGVGLYDALIAVSRAGYGEASLAFGSAAHDVASGTPIASALERMAARSESQYLKRTTWQLVNTLRSGASLEGALRSLIDGLMLSQRDKIRGYTQELNLWVLLYMLFAVAIPTLGITMMIILSGMAGLGVTPGLFVAFLVICFFVQVLLIGFIHSRRPVVDL
ncbi:hypothetical protein AUJ68_06730 [Candidatus Woesearchaeota archaeon CG1_02_57_44]|nr:MAG: hypothetical protein AUJ68_06730 [Candidatus Woesearchaeota archaeon CG1_02_57_44]